MVANLCYVWPQVTKTIDCDNLADWGVKFSEVMQVAKKNHATETVGLAKIGKGCYAILNYDTFPRRRDVTGLRGSFDVPYSSTQ
jgi:hypothetical protein